MQLIFFISHSFVHSLIRQYFLDSVRCRESVVKTGKILSTSIMLTLKHWLNSGDLNKSYISSNFASSCTWPSKVGRMRPWKWSSTEIPVLLSRVRICDSLWGAQPALTRLWSFWCPLSPCHILTGHPVPRPMVMGEWSCAYWVRTWLTGGWAVKVPILPGQVWDWMQRPQSWQGRARLMVPVPGMRGEWPGHSRHCIPLCPSWLLRLDWSWEKK